MRTVAPTPGSSSTSARVLPTLLAIAGIAGTLDISDNLIFNALRGVTPAMVFRFIASGLLGPPAALRLGMVAVALGVLMHYTIAFTWTAVFYVASRRLPFLLRRPLLWGPVYGAGVYLVMTLIAVPLSRVPHVQAVITLANRINAVLALLLCIGLTIALLSRRWLPI